MTPDDLRQEVELKVVELIKAKLADGTLAEDRAQAISQMVLDKLTPGMTFAQLFKVIPTLDDIYQELSPVILPILAEYEKKVVQQAKENVRELIRQGQYDAATTLAQRAVSQDIEMVWTGQSH